MENKIMLVGEWIPASNVLEAIVGLSGFTVEVLYTNPETNRELVTLAERNQVEVVDVKKLKESDVSDVDHRRIDWLLSVNSTVILPPTVLKVPRSGALNMHPGLLPEYAGLHTHQWAIRNGEKEFGATLHWMEPGVDTGPIAYRQVIPLLPTHTGLSLFMDTLKVGTGLVVKCLEFIARGESPPRIPQDHSKRHLYKHKDALDGRLPIERTAQEVADFVRAADYGPLTSPTYIPTIYSKAGPISVHKAVPSTADVDAKPGTILSISSEGIKLAVGSGESVMVTVISLAGNRGRPGDAKIAELLDLSAGDRLWHEE